MPDYDENRIERLERKADKFRMKNKNKTWDHAAVGGVLDKYSVETINKFKKNGVINDFVGIISSGKEANVYIAYNSEQKPIAVKVYKIDPQNTKWMKNYIIGDPRFKKIGTTTHKIIYTWCAKEYKNLTQLYRAKVQVPKPIVSMNNVLIMEFIGEENGTPAPRLKDAIFENDPEIEFDFIMSQIKKMYTVAHLVHADLSEFNILYFNKKQIIIDVSQAVSIQHSNAPIFLERDLKNVIKFYAQYIPQSKLPDYEIIAKQIIQNV